MRLNRDRQPPLRIEPAEGPDGPAGVSPARQPHCDGRHGDGHPTKLGHRRCEYCDALTDAITLVKSLEQRVVDQAIRAGIDAITKAGERLGRALWEIRDDRLYRASHTSFERYARDRWNLTARHANRLIHFAQVTAVLGPIGPGIESQARELAPLLDRPPVMRQVWAKVARRGKPTAKTIRAAVHETVQTPADGPTAQGPAGGGSPAMRGEAHAGDSPIQTPSGATGAPSTARSPEGTPPVAADTPPGEGDGPAGPGWAPGRSVSGVPGARSEARTGAPTDPRPTPQPASPPSAGPESGGAGAPSSSSRVDGAAGASPSARPVADGEAPWVEPILTSAEVHAALTDEAFELYLPDFGCRLAMVHTVAGMLPDWAVVRAYRQSLAVA